jgi:hypothetical protein
MPAALAELETAWTAGGYHGVSHDHGTWPAISSAGERPGRGYSDELEREIPAHWQAMQ